ncbi:MAG: sigma-70 family RNA polymerase sigma factor [Dysgonamonadaceae bacterium]|jgi:RNA polymerase sigma-70 factor (ECF subfamily)|nr:sigma-70 family RNA polymerase sigma factor [Dysgonamonadaceae bacterium]
MNNKIDMPVIKRILEGDSRAFEEIVSVYGKKVFALVSKMVDRREDAEDISQEVFIRVFKSIGMFREDAGFSTWIYRIAYNTAVSELRKRKILFIPIEDETAESDTEGNGDAEAETESKLCFLDRALKKLPPDERFLITLYYMEDRTMDEISAVSGLSPGNVKVKMYRIRKKLEKEINKLMCL